MTRTAAREATPTLSCVKSFLKASQHMVDTCNTRPPPEQIATYTRRHVETRSQESDLGVAVVHQRGEGHDDVVVEVEVRESQQQLTQAADGHLGQATVRLQRHRLAALPLLLFPVWTRRGKLSVRQTKLWSPVAAATYL